MSECVLVNSQSPLVRVQLCFGDSSGAAPVRERTLGCAYEYIACHGGAGDSSKGNKKERKKKSTLEDTQRRSMHGGSARKRNTDRATPGNGVAIVCVCECVCVFASSVV